MIGTGALHPATAVLDTSPEITAAHHDAHLNAHGYRFFNDIAYLADDRKIQAKVLITGQSLPADLQ